MRAINHMQSCNKKQPHSHFCSVNNQLTVRFMRVNKLEQDREGAKVALAPNKSRRQPTTTTLSAGFSHSHSLSDERSLLPAKELSVVRMRTRPLTTASSVCAQSNKKARISRQQQQQQQVVLRVALNLSFLLFRRLHLISHSHSHSLTFGVLAAEA